jgi:hypothetical protein
MSWCGTASCGTLLDLCIPAGCFDFWSTWKCPAASILPSHAETPKELNVRGWTTYFPENRGHLPLGISIAGSDFRPLCEDWALTRGTSAGIRNWGLEWGIGDR